MCTGTHDPELVRYDEDGDRCYAVYSPDYVSENLAASNCEQWYGEGLAEVGSAAEHSLLTQFVATADPYKGMWIGLRRDDPGGAFRWASGDPVDFDLWGTDQPNHVGPGTCVYMFVGADLYWHDDSCTLEEINGFAYLWALPHLVLWVEFRRLNGELSKRRTGLPAVGSAAREWLEHRRTTVER